MDFLTYLTATLFAIWCASEIAISTISFRNLSKGSSNRKDRLSHFVMWCSIMPPIWFAMLIRTHVVLYNGLGSFSGVSSLLGYVGCPIIALGVATRLVAVATLKRQFTIVVSIVQKHQIIDTGIYKTIRHPAYLGTLASLLGFGLVSGNWFSLAALIVLPITATSYRIHVEERALLRHFGLAYQEYAGRTKRLLPGIY